MMKWIYFFQHVKDKVNGWLGLAAVLVVLLAGCKATPEGVKKIVVDLKQKGMDETEFLKLVTDIRLIPLETPDSALIHFYDQLYSDEHGIYILDDKENTLFMFNPDGSFRSKLCRVGRAPGEYMGLSDFEVDADGHLFLYDGSMGVLYEYDSNGVFVGKMDLPCGDQFKLLEDGYAVYSGNWEDYTFYIVNKQGEVLQKYLSTEDMLPHNTNSNGSMTKLGNRLFFSPVFDYTVYEVAGDSCVPRYTFDFLSDNLPADILNAKDYRAYIEKIVTFKGVVGLGNLYAYDEWLTFFGAADAVFFNMETGQPYVLNDLGGPLFTLSGNPWFGNDKGEIYTHITASNLIHGQLPAIDMYVDDYPFLKTLKERKIQETDNDWIFVAKLKE